MPDSTRSVNIHVLRSTQNRATKWYMAGIRALPAPSRNGTLTYPPPSGKQELCLLERWDRCGRDPPGRACRHLRIHHAARPHYCRTTQNPCSRSRCASGRSISSRSWWLLNKRKSAPFGRHRARPDEISVRTPDSSPAPVRVDRIRGEPAQAGFPSGGLGAAAPTCGCALLPPIISPTGPGRCRRFSC